MSTLDANEEVSNAFADIRAAVAKAEEMVDVASDVKRSQLEQALKEKEEAMDLHKEAAEAAAFAREGQLAAETRTVKYETKYAAKKARS